ncbi:MAG: NAD-dependent epimerase/dehydratase family protein [Mucilaginibacter sp.]|nr:NAD-dependent epimerase/dehydratase family protein [Mucilaginibacter sp.]
MKITVTGSLGNISKPLAKQLINVGHQVTIISSNANRTAEIEALGAKAAIGNIADADFLTKAFTEADVVYTMVPPNFGAANYRQYVADAAKSYAEAIQKAGITRVVNLSSIGADIDGGTGQIAGNHDAEIILNALPNVAIKHIRAGFFFVNFYANIDMIKHLGFIGSNYDSDARLIMVHPADIAAAIAEEIEQGFAGKSVRYITSDERSTGEIATILGKAIGKPDLKWVEFTDEQNLNGMLQAGLPQEVSSKFVEMGTAIRSGILWNDYDAKVTKPTGKTKLEDFTKEFAARF